MSNQDSDFLGMTADIIAAYVTRNHVSPSELPNIIVAVHGALSGVTGAAAVEPETRTPAVPVKKSVTPDAIICLEDGRKLKSLKRHLRTKYNMSPEDYRAKWNLPKDYPMVAPNYAAARSELARAMGLGQGGRKPAAAPAAAPAAEPPKRGRRP